MFGTRRGMPAQLAMLAIACLWMGWCPDVAVAQRFGVSPSSEALFADELRIVLEGVQPGAEVEIRAERSMTFGGPDPRLFKSSARLVADAGGSVDLASAIPVAGSY